MTEGGRAATPCWRNQRSISSHINAGVAGNGHARMRGQRAAMPAHRLCRRWPMVRSGNVPLSSASKAAIGNIRLFIGEMGAANVRQPQSGYLMSRLLDIALVPSTDMPYFSTNIFQICRQYSVLSHKITIILEAKPGTSRHRRHVTLICGC